MTRARLRQVTRALLPALGALALGCAHAPPATGTRGGPNARPDPINYPEINCDLNNTVDCRPGGAKG